MADIPIQTRVMTIEEFAQRYDEEGPFEIIDGEIIEMSPSVFGPSEIADTLMTALKLYAIPRKLGNAYMEIPFILPDTYSPQWVKGSRVPDVMYFRAEKLAAYKSDTKGYRTLPLMMIPDLVVEVVSPTDNYTEISKKITRYLSDGIKIVWVVDPQTKTVSVHLLGSKQQTNLSGEDKLTGGDVIPGFEITVASIFD